MGEFLRKLHAWLDPIALRIINSLNAIAGVVMIGLTAFSALHPNFPAEVQAALHLSPLQGMLLGVVWCSLIAYVGKRAAKA
jgi:hypothetical protein